MSSNLTARLSRVANLRVFYHLSLANSLDHPVLLAERAAIVLFHPQGHAAVVKGMITFSPDHNTVLLFVFSLTSKAGIHHLDPADGAGVALNVPAPHGYRVPFLEGEHLVAPRPGACSPGVRGQQARFLAGGLPLLSHKFFSTKFLFIGL